MGLALHQRLQHFSLLPPIIWPLLPLSLHSISIFLLSSLSLYIYYIDSATYTRIYVHTRQVITFALVASRILHSILPILSCPFNYPESRMVQHRLSLMRDRERRRGKGIQTVRRGRRRRRTLIMHRCHRYRRALYVWDRNVFPLLTLFPVSLRKKRS